MNDINPHESGRRPAPEQSISSLRSARQSRTATICAVQLPIIIWALCAYMLASQLFGLSNWPSLAVAAGCAYVVYLVERLVLSTPRTKGMFTARFMLTLLMSALGACVFDLVIFEKDIKAELSVKEEAAYMQKMQPEIQRKTDDVRAKDQAREAALQKANCEADGTCGSGKRLTGPIWRALMLQAEQKRDEYLTADKELEALKARVRVDAVAAGKRAAEEAGVLQRLQALHDYIGAHKPALAWWVVLFLVIMLLEASVLLAKYAGGKGIVDKVHDSHEAAILQLMERHAQIRLDGQAMPRRLR